VRFYSSSSVSSPLYSGLFGFNWSDLLSTDAWYAGLFGFFESDLSSFGVLPLLPFPISLVSSGSY